MQREQSDVEVEHFGIRRPFVLNAAKVAAVLAVPGRGVLATSFRFLWITETCTAWQLQFYKVLSSIRCVQRDFSLPPPKISNEMLFHYWHTVDSA